MSPHQVIPTIAASGQTKYTQNNGVCYYSMDVDTMLKTLRKSCKKHLNNNDD